MMQIEPENRQPLNQSNTLPHPTHIQEQDHSLQMEVKPMSAQNLVDSQREADIEPEHPQEQLNNNPAQQVVIGAVTEQNTMEQQSHPQSSAPKPRASQVSLNFKHGQVDLSLKRTFIRLHIMHEAQQPEKVDQNPTSLEGLFPDQGKKLKQAVDVLLTVTNRRFPAILKPHLKSITDLYDWVIKNINNEEKLVITREHLEFHITSSCRILLTYEQLLKKSDPLKVDLNNIEQRLMQFSDSQMQFMSQAEQCWVHQNYQSVTQQFKEVLELMDPRGKTEDDVFEEFYEEPEKDENYKGQLNRISELDEATERFDQKYARKISRAMKGIRGELAAPKPPRKTNQAGFASVFPPGYVPPTARQEGAQLRFHPSQTQKEKMKIAKQLLKQGSSVKKIIEMLEQVENSAPQKKKIFHFTRPSTSQQSASQAASYNESEKRVRQMLVTLLREKRFKTLNEIYHHILDSGLHTTLASLKRMIDEIRAKSKSKASNQAQSE